MNTWILLMLLATGETVMLPVSPIDCAVYVARLAKGELPSVPRDGRPVLVVSAVCAPSTTTGKPVTVRQAPGPSPKPKAKPAAKRQQDASAGLK